MSVDEHPRPVPAGVRRAPDLDEDAIRTVLSDETLPRLVFQPIVDLQRGTVVGYETLSRFPGPPQAPPDVWFQAAATYGLQAALETRVLAAALELVDDLPPSTFLTINLDPNLLGRPEVCEVLDRPLDKVVLELTEHALIADLGAVQEALRRPRARGLTLALDDAGAGYSGLVAMLQLRPDIVKVDRTLVTDVDRDAVKRALLETLGSFAGQSDAWVLVEGLERIGELQECARMGVPLGQGYLLGRPGPAWQTQVDLDLVNNMLQMAESRRAVDTVTPVLTTAMRARSLDEARETFERDPSIEVLVLVDDIERPLGLLLRSDVANRRTPLRRALLVKPTDRLTDVARRMTARESETRFDPAVCCDGRGSLIGLVRTERVLRALAARASVQEAPAATEISLA